MPNPLIRKTEKKIKLGPSYLPDLITLRVHVTKDIPTEEPTAGINAGVSFVFVLPVSQHDVVTSKAYLPGGIDG